MNSGELVATLLLTTVVGLIGVVLDLMLGTSFYLPRVIFLAVGLAYIIVAASVFKAMRRPSVNLSLGLFIMAVGGSGVYLYIWLNAFLGRPAWFRENFVSVFVFFISIKAVGVLQHLVTIGHTRGRGRLFVLLMLGCLGVSAIVNIWGSMPVS